MRAAADVTIPMQQIDNAPAGAVRERAMSQNDRYENYEAVPAGCNLLDGLPLVVSHELSFGQDMSRHSGLQLGLGCASR